MRTALTLAPLALLAACQMGGPAQYGDVLPDSRLMVEVPHEASQARSVGEISEYYELTRDITDEVNLGVGEVLTLIDEITAFQPTWSSADEDTALWGPWEEDGIQGQLWVHHDGDDAYSWALELREAGTEAWTPVLAGQTDPGATLESSSGRFALDFTAADALDASDGISGGVVAEYELRPDGASATVFFGDITEAEDQIPQDAAYEFEHTEGVGGSMDVAVTEDVTEGGALELVILRSRWDAAGAGRTDAVVTEGDVGPLTYSAVECWSPAKTVVFHENNYEMVSDGDATDCAFDAFQE